MTDSPPDLFCMTLPNGECVAKVCTLHSWWNPTEVLPGDLRLSTSLTPRDGWVDDGISTAIVDTFDACWRCKRDTYCIDLAFECRLCPECHDIEWQAYADTFDREPEWVPFRPVENVVSPYL